MEQFKEKLADIFEVQEVNDTDVMQDFEAWDSLTLLTIIATVDSEFGVTLSAADFEQIKTIGDLQAFIAQKKN